MDICILTTQLLLSVLLAIKSDVSGDSETSTAAAVSTQSQHHTLLEKHNTRNYCVSHGDFYCVKADGFVCIRAGMCMTEPGLRTNSSTEIIAAAGFCPYFPHQSTLCPSPLNGYYQIPLSLSDSELTNFTCNYYNRQGLMCCQCQKGYGPAVYAFSLMCAKCSDSVIGWVLYFALTLLPITVFYFIVVLFSIRVTSPPLTRLVFMCQTFSFVDRLYVDLDMKVVITSGMYTDKNERLLRLLIQTVRTLCGFWNLDFFRSVAPPFCVSSHLTNMQALFLEYVYVFYPLSLVVITCTCINGHDRNFKPLVTAWKPFHRLFVRLQNTWDPTASIVYSFSTFTLLYTSKLLFVSSYSIYPTKVYYLKPSVSYNKSSDYREYFDPSNKLYSKYYWHFVSCSIIFVLIFLVCPIVLLCLYPFKFFRRFFHYILPSKWELVLCTFLDTFQGHYKDGTNCTRDYRSFSAVHLILLGLIVSFRIELHTNVYATLPAQVICIVGSLLFAIARPYKKKYANIIQSLLMALTAFALLTLIPAMSSERAAYNSLFIMLMCMLAPHIVFGGCIIYRIIYRAKTKFGISIRIPSCLRHAFGKHEDETIYTLPVNNTDMIRSHLSQQGIIIPTENTGLLKSAYTP